MGYIYIMKYTIRLKKSVTKNLGKLPSEIQRKFVELTWVLMDCGPTGPYKWRNYSKLSKEDYHCHLSYHYAACWRSESKTIIIEVYYVGSRENAPY